MPTLYGIGRRSSVTQALRPVLEPYYTRSRQVSYRGAPACTQGRRDVYGRRSLPVGPGLIGQHRERWTGNPVLVRLSGWRRRLDCCAPTWPTFTPQSRIPMVDNARSRPVEQLGRRALEFAVTLIATQRLCPPRQHPARRRPRRHVSWNASSARSSGSRAAHSPWFVSRLSARPRGAIQPQVASAGRTARRSRWPHAPLEPSTAVRTRSVVDRGTTPRLEELRHK